MKIAQRDLTNDAQNEEELMKIGRFLSVTI